MKQRKWLYVLLATALPARAQDNSAIARATAFLKKVPPHATLAHVKPILPKGTKFGARGAATQGDGKTWIVQAFSGPLNGQLIFFNNRRAPQRKAGMPPAPPFDGAHKILGRNDQVHSVEIFLSGARRNRRRGELTTETRRYVNAVANQLGKPTGSRNTGETGGPDANGWKADWKLPGGRKISFIHSFALLSGDERPLLTLAFSYAQIYRP